jgi:hypothetical protein
MRHHTKESNTAATPKDKNVRAESANRYDGINPVNTFPKRFKYTSFDNFAIADPIVLDVRSGSHLQTTYPDR